MAQGLREDIQQKKAFRSSEEETFLNIVRTATQLEDAFETMLKPHGVSLTQYNVLRMLRGAGVEGLCRNEIRDRMVTRMPDVTRLLDRMEEAGLVKRSRSDEDRRQVGTELTRKGRDLVDSLDEVVEHEHEARLGHLTRAQLKTLQELLTLARKKQ